MRRDSSLVQTLASGIHARSEGHLTSFSSLSSRAPWKVPLSLLTEFGSGPAGALEHHHTERNTAGRPQLPLTWVILPPSSSRIPCRNTRSSVAHLSPLLTRSPLLCVRLHLCPLPRLDPAFRRTAALFYIPLTEFPAAGLGTRLVDTVTLSDSSGRDRNRCGGLRAVESGMAGITRAWVYSLDAHEAGAIPELSPGSLIPES